MSSTSISFSPGTLVSLQCEWGFFVEFMAFMSPASSVNLPFAESKKFHPGFKRLGARKIARIVQQVQEVAGVTLHTHNSTGKLLALSFSELNASDNVIVGLIGQGNEAIRFCTGIFEKFVAVNKTKMIVLVLLEGNIYNMQKKGVTQLI